MRGLRFCFWTLSILLLSNGLSCNKNETKTTVADYIPPGYFDLEVSVFPKGQSIAMSYGLAREVTEKAVTEIVKDSSKFTCLQNSGKMFTFYWDPSPEGEKTDVSDWQELAVITLPKGQCQNKRLILNYKFEDKVTLTYSIEDKN